MSACFTRIATELLVPGATPALEVNVCADPASVEVMHHGRMVTIMRNQNQSNSVDPDFARLRTNIHHSAFSLVSWCLA